MKHALLISELLTTPWALRRDRIDAFAAVMIRRLAGERSAIEDDDSSAPRQSVWEARREQARALGGGGIAVLPLYGTIVQRAGMMTEWCGGTSTQQFTQAFREALADPAVSGILVDIDSPGGSVYGVAELADEIYAARASKPIAATANSLAASAAYWIGAAAGDFTVTPGGEVGSIGVWGAHEDWSKYLDEMGVKTTLVSAGKFKTEGNPYGPLDAEALAFQQKRVDEYYTMFTRGVAKYRGVPVDQVRSGMGQGRVLGPADAKAENMVDEIATFDEAVKRLSRNIRDAGKTAGARTDSAAQRRREMEILGA